MSSIFKSLQPKDVRVTPYQSYKKMTSNFSDGNASVYTASYSTVEDDYEAGLLRQVDRLFYRNYLDSYHTTPGGTDINYQYRVLGSKAKIISIPTSKIGEGVLPTTVEITGSGVVLVDDGYGNLRRTSSTEAPDYNNLYASYDFGRYYDYVGQGIVESLEQVVTYGALRLHASFSNVAFVQDANGKIGVRLMPTSSIQLTAFEAPEATDRYNFTNRDFAIAVGVQGSTGTVLTKQKPVLDWTFDSAGNPVYNTTKPANFPYKVSINGGTIQLQKTNGTTTVTRTGGNVTSYADVVLQRSGSQLQVYTNGSAATTTDTLYQDDVLCANKSDILVGGDSFDGTLYYLYFYDKHLSTAEIQTLNNTNGAYNGIVGNVFYKLGIAVITDPLVVANNANSVTSLKYRSTVTALETQAFCTVGPGDFQVTFNKSVQTWDSTTSQYVVASTYTGSEFRPYVTTIGLYDDYNNLVAVAKLSTPIQTSRTTDTTFIVKFDR